MYSFSRTEGWYEGRPVAAGSTPSKPISAKSSASTNTSITRTGLLSSMKSSRHSGNSVHCPRSDSSTKRFTDSPKNHRRIITAAPRFHTARVKSGKVQIEQMFSGLHLKADTRRSREKNRKHPAMGDGCVRIKKRSDMQSRPLSATADIEQPCRKDGS